MLQSKDKQWLTGLASICYLKRLTDPKMREWKKILHAKEVSKEMETKEIWVAILIKDKLGFEKDPITKDKENYYILIKGSM